MPWLPSLVHPHDAVVVNGLTGATAATRYVGATASGAPASGTFVVGDFVITQDGSIFICTAAGSPGTWTEVSGSGGGDAALGYSGAKAYLTADQTLTDATAAAVSFDAQDHDTDDYWEGVTNPSRFTVPTAGKYLVEATVPFVYNADDEQRYIHFRVNGSSTNQYGGQAMASNASTTTAGTHQLSTSVVLDLAAGDYVELWARQDSGGNLNIDGDQSASNALCEMSITRIGQAGFSGAKAERSTDTASLTTATWTSIDMTTELFDTDGYYENVTNPERFTVPVSGRYAIDVMAAFATNSTGTRRVRLYKNGTTVPHVRGYAAVNIAANSGSGTIVTMSEVLDLAAGDYIEFQAYQDSGGGLVVEAASLAITKLDGAVADQPDVPEWVSYLAARRSDETAHTDDDFFQTDSLTDYTEVTVSGTATWQIGRGLLSVVVDDQSSSDMAVLLKAVPSSHPLTIETAIRALRPSQSSNTIGLVFTDGTTATDDVVSAIQFDSTSSQGLRKRFGTLTDMFGTTNQTVVDVSNINAGTLYVRLIWSAANTFNAQWSPDGVTWTDYGAADITPTFTPTHMGLLATTHGGTDPLVVTFEYFRVYESDLS